ncbi:hypothetical protein BpHYR1_027608 [Brachionus plicatilis]|uniref:Uncharacterized protein n=1 Tax=Brachionus plicatilis TaxID=10195 RepID=A0A3M7QS36_BRAPC|nr:hypothetical protein BpHYR1_027608 [Brachionus plicatilis]
MLRMKLQTKYHFFLKRFRIFYYVEQNNFFSLFFFSLCIYSFNFLIFTSI